MRPERARTEHDADGEVKDQQHRGPHGLQQEKALGLRINMQVGITATSFECMVQRWDHSYKRLKLGVFLTFMT